MSDVSPRRRWRFPMRWKLLTAFVSAFTVVFVAIAFWVVHYAGDAASNRLADQLLEAAEGASEALPVGPVAKVIALPPDSDPTQNPAYERLTEDLAAVVAIFPSAEPIIYTAEDGKLTYLVGDQPFREPVAQTQSPSTVEFMQKGLSETTLQPTNTDGSGTWISAYSPIVDENGEKIAAVGIDYSVAYVQEVRERARVQVFPVLAVSYVSLIVLVLIVSTLMVRPLQRLTLATKRVAAGEYDLDLGAIGAEGRFADEMSDLADSFAVMATKVAARERALTKEVQRLQVEIDTTKREESVREITETDFFADLAAKAEQLRSTMRPDQ